MAMRHTVGLSGRKPGCSLLCLALCHVMLFGVIVVGCGWGLVCGWLSALCGRAVVVWLCGVGLLVVNWIVDVMMHLCVSVMFFCCC
jgi:hypothetical protein